MGSINTARVLLGGLLAGLIINAGEYILNDRILDWKPVMQTINRPAIGSQAIIWFVVLGFVLGILCVWLYAAIRPRYGVGPKTAICAGLAAWAFAYFYPTVGMIGLDIFPRQMMLTALVWGLVEVPLATVLGAWLYKE
jgi:hypothetical protein